MTFKQLAEYFQRLERTSSRLEMTRILAELFKETSEAEIAQICYLSLGRLTPLYESLEFQLAEKMAARAIAVAFEKEKQRVLVDFKRMGDLGVVGEALARNSKFQIPNSKLTVLDVYKQLRKIAEESGQGSQERKVKGLAELLQKLDALGVRYLTRMVVGKLRLGFSDKTIIDALSWMKMGDKSLRDDLEKAYFVRADIGALAEVFKKHGKKGLQEFSPKLGVPVMPTLCQRLKTAREMLQKMGKVVAEPKFDGTRCISGSTGLLIRKRGFISVREVEVGDEVLTHKGRFQPIVAKTYRWRKVGEKVFRLQTYLGNRLTVSEGHRLLVEHKGRLAWKPVEEIKGYWLFFPAPTVTAKAVPGEYVFRDKAGYTKKVMFSHDFFRLLGYWVGDGISNSSHQMERVGLIFNREDTRLIAAYSAMVREVLKIADISRDERQGAVVLYWRDPVFRRWLVDNFRGEKESGKRIPEWFFGLDSERFLAFLRGWQEADGTDRKGGNRIVTKERQLALMAQVLGFKHGQPIGIRKVRMKPSGFAVTKTYYELIAPKGDRYVRQVRGGYVVKLRNFQQMKVSGKLRLYDIEVKGDRSFCTSVATLHNCQIHISGKEFLRTFTRNMEESTFMFPELKQAHAQVAAESVILDSEAVGIDPKTGKFLSFQDTMVRKRKHKVAEMSLKVPLRFFVFDVLFKDGESLLPQPLAKRRKILENLLEAKSDGLLQLTEQVRVSGPEELLTYHSKQLKKGLEGAVVKKTDSAYVPGRRAWNWVKFKEVETARGGLADTLDCVVMGYYRGKGKRANFGIGAFLVGVRKGEQFLTIAKIGTGLSDEQWKEIKATSDKRQVTSKPKEYVVDKSLVPDVWVSPMIVVEIAADNLTRSPNHSAKLALRFPRLVRFRDDKRVEQATSVGEVERMVG